MEDKIKEAYEKADNREILIDEDGNEYYMVGDIKITAMTIINKTDEAVARNIAAMRFGGFKSGFDLMR